MNDNIVILMMISEKINIFIFLGIFLFKLCLSLFIMYNLKLIIGMENIISLISNRLFPFFKIRKLKRGEEGGTPIFSLT